MKKNVIRWIVLAVLALLMFGCAKKTLHCDGCGSEVKVSADSNLTEDSLILCKDCQKKLYGDP